MGSSSPTQERASPRWSRRNQKSQRTRNRCGSGPVSLSRYQRTAAARLPCLGVQALAPLALAGAAQRPVGLLGQRPVEVGVPPADLGGVGPGRQPLGHERADGLQHPQPGAVVGGVEVDQAVPGQRLEPLQRLVLVQTGHLGGGLGGPAVHEHRRDLQQRPLGVVQQPDAPLHRGPQGALPLGQVHRARPERVQRRGQPAEQGVRVEQPGAGGRQLDRQRQAVEPPADLRHRRRVALGEGEAGPRRAGPVHEQRHRRRLPPAPPSARRRGRRAATAAAPDTRAPPAAPAPYGWSPGSPRRDSGPAARRCRRPRRPPARGCRGSAATGRRRSTRPGPPAASPTRPARRPPPGRRPPAPARAR